MLSPVPSLRSLETESWKAGTPLYCDTSCNPDTCWTHWYKVADGSKRSWASDSVPLRPQSSAALTLPLTMTTAQTLMSNINSFSPGKLTTTEFS